MKVQEEPLAHGDEVYGRRSAENSFWTQGLCTYDEVMWHDDVVTFCWYWGYMLYDDVMFLYVMMRLYDVLGETLAAFVENLEGV